MYTQATSGKHTYHSPVIADCAAAAGLCTVAFCNISFISSCHSPLCLNILFDSEPLSLRLGQRCTAWGHHRQGFSFVMCQKRRALATTTKMGSTVAYFVGCWQVRLRREAPDRTRGRTTRLNWVSLIFRRYVSVGVKFLQLYTAGTSSTSHSCPTLAPVSHGGAIPPPRWARALVQCHRNRHISHGCSRTHAMTQCHPTAGIPERWDARTSQPPKPHFRMSAGGLHGLRSTCQMSLGTWQTQPFIAKTEMHETRAVAWSPARRTVIGLAGGCWRERGCLS